MKSILNRFKSDNRGAVSLEFVLIISLYTYILFISFVAFDALLIYNKAGKANAAVSNLVSRVGSVDDVFVEELFQVYKNMAYASSGEASLRLTAVSSVLISDGLGGEVLDLQVRWSDEEGTKYDPLESDDILLDNRVPNMVNGDEWMLLETSLSFTPVLKNLGIPTTSFDHYIVFIPRFTGKTDHDDLVAFADNDDGSTEPAIGDDP